jgi:hypothetical protein
VTNAIVPKCRYRALLGIEKLLFAVQARAIFA